MFCLQVNHISLTAFPSPNFDCLSYLSQASCKKSKYIPKNRESPKGSTGCFAMTVPSSIMGQELFNNSLPPWFQTTFTKPSKSNKSKQCTAAPTVMMWGSVDVSVPLTTPLQLSSLVELRGRPAEDSTFVSGSHKQIIVQASLKVSLRLELFGQQGRLPAGDLESKAEADLQGFRPPATRGSTK